MPPVLPVQSVHPKTLTVRTALQKSAPASPQSQQSLLPHTTPSPITESPAVSSTGYLPPPLIDNTLAGHGGTQMTLTSYPNHFDQSLIRMHWLQALVEEEAKKDVAPNPSAEAQEDENAGPGMSQSGCGDSVPDSPFHNDDVPPSMRSKNSSIQIGEQSLTTNLR
ncbi:hypothetical protein M378DRAFT_17682 [Amanita muscaria Koide BX008]|uniref:Uncharacterized protein n=1 Tax=Amanita muscaria (strain Koide BX008) TaxID=946122 RepID=A0A0C2W3N3_AMAMK|nr:hypothetical protein M378DRAFT_17682 [Amanita muscaria Koide BX008]